MFDVTGKELELQRELEQQNRIDMSIYTPGIYFLKITEIDTNKVQTIKIIKE